MHGSLSLEGNGFRTPENFEVTLTCNIQYHVQKTELYGCEIKVFFTSCPRERQLYRIGTLHTLGDIVTAAMLIFTQHLC